ncbi:hypothetical protein [Mesorhizobium sp. IMUNJ 23232]|uniref:hypothetical protein n=1 Tax=Mesorhizobium sp. IMUNJ 23232 TaxID=3376064 RepID=UPI0037BC0597
MDRRERKGEQETLNRIAFMLLRLAVLAQLLCVLPLPVRAFVLSFLRPAEAVARAFANERAGGALALPPAAIRSAGGDGCAEALRLARCLRVLASILGGLQGSGGRRLFRCRPDGHPAQHAAAIVWLGHFMRARGAIVLRGAGRIDTS